MLNMPHICVKKLKIFKSNAFFMFIFVEGYIEEGSRAVLGR